MFEQRRQYRQFDGFDLNVFWQNSTFHTDTEFQMVELAPPCYPSQSPFHVDLCESLTMLIIFVKKA